jgi:alpha-L-fucosidase
MTTPWFATDRTRIFFDMHLPDWPEKEVATRFDPEALAQTFAETGAESVVFYAKCQYGNFYYPSRRGHLHSGLKGRDLFGDFAKAAHRRGLKVIAYYSAAWDTRTAFDHPEWLTLDRDGKVFLGRWPTLCLNSPYRTVVLEHLREISAETPADGVWLDMAIIGKARCYCAWCTEKFRQRFGVEPPRSESDPCWRQFLNWRYEVTETLFAEARDTVKQDRPDFVYCNNYWGYPYMDASMGSRAAGALRSVDYATGEGYSEWSGITSPSLFAKYLRDASDGKPVEVLLSRFHETWDFTLRPVTQIAFEAFAVAANGATVTLDDEPYHDGTIEPAVYRTLKPVFGEIQARKELITETEPLRFAGIWYSQKTHDRYIGEQNRDFIASIAGTYKALIEAHVPVGFVFDELLTPDLLKRYAVLVLPSVSDLTPGEMQILQEYVHQGGALVCLGTTGSIPGMDGLLGFRYAGVSNHDIHYLEIPCRAGGLRRDFGELSRAAHSSRSPAAAAAPAALQEQLDKLPLLVEGPAYQVAASTGTGSGALIYPICDNTDQTYYHNNLPAPHTRSEFPTAVRHQASLGKTIYFAADLARQFARNGQPVLRDIIVDAVNEVARAELPVRVNCPRTTELVIQVDRQRRWICHFLSVHLKLPTWYGELAIANDRAARTKDVYEETFPIHNVELSVKRLVTEARLYPGNIQLETTKIGQTTTVRIPRIELWETVVLTFGD